MYPLLGFENQSVFISLCYKVKYSTGIPYMSITLFIMIAIVEIGGKQHTVEKGQTFDVDNQNLEVGSTFDLPAMLLADAEGKSVQIGTPTVVGSKVTFTVVDNFKDEKIRVFKIIPKKRHTRTHGFRAHRTLLRVESIA